MYKRCMKIEGRRMNTMLPVSPLGLPHRQHTDNMCTLSATNFMEREGGLSDVKSLYKYSTSFLIYIHVSAIIYPSWLILYCLFFFFFHFIFLLVLLLSWKVSKGNISRQLGFIVSLVSCIAFFFFLTKSTFF